MTVNEAGEAGLNRRKALGLAAGAGSAALGLRALAQTAVPAPTPNSATEIRVQMQQLAPDVWAYIQREAPGQSNLSVSNCGIIAGPKGLLAIDATSAPVHAKRFRALAESTTGSTIKQVVITHMHGDHVLGLQFLGDGVQVIAQEECASAMARGSTTKSGLWSGSNPAWADGTETYRLVTANTTYSERMTLFGYTPSQVQLYWPGRAHTLGDTNVYLPDEKIIFIGDIGFFDVAPLNGSGYVANWIKVCDDILAMDVKTIVPGHGPVGGKAELEDMKQYLILLYNESKKRFDRGVSPGRAAAEIDLGHYADWTDADRIVNNVVRVYGELSGTMGAAMLPTAVPAARAEYNRIKGL